jgi:ribosomal protein S8
MITAQQATQMSHPDELANILGFVKRNALNKTNYVIVSHLCNTNKNLLEKEGYIVTYEYVNEHHQWSIIW